jgi:hypothetical protein
MRSPGSILEIDTDTVDDKVHFKRFFCYFRAAIDGFRNGCRIYISIDSTSLNRLWNGHLPAACNTLYFASKLTICILER